MPAPMRKQFIRALYWQSGVFLSVGTVAEMMRLAFTRPQDMKTVGWDLAVSPIIDLGVGLFTVGAYLDYKYFRMNVIREFLPQPSY